MYVNIAVNGINLSPVIKMLYKSIILKQSHLVVGKQTDPSNIECTEIFIYIIKCQHENDEKNQWKKKVQ